MPGAKHVGHLENLVGCTEGARADQYGHFLAGIEDVGSLLEILLSGHDGALREKPMPVNAVPCLRGGDSTAVQFLNVIGNDHTGHARSALAMRNARSIDRAHLGGNATIWT